MRLQLDTVATGADSTRSAESAQSSAVGRPTPDSTQAASSSSGAQDSIQISGALSALNSSNADRTAQIQQLTSAVQSGSYQVSAASIGSAVVEHAIS